MRKLSRWYEGAILACLCAAAFTLVARGISLAAASIAHNQGFAPNDACVGNLRLIGNALLQYEEDFDEGLPTTHTITQFQAALSPFAKDPALYVCPDTGLPYTPNAAISNQSLTAFAEPETVEVLQDTKPHADGLSTVLFLDRHIERGGVEQGDPSVICIAHARTVAIGVVQYVQDNTPDVYPPMHSEAEFEAAIYPYTQSHRAFINPVDGKPFALNAALSGVSASSITDPAHTVLFQSAGPLPNGYPVIAYADGHVTNGPTQSNINIDSNLDNQNLLRIMQGVNNYSQDHDNSLPTTTDYATFKSEILPYVGNDESFFTSPGSGLPYVLNPAVNGLSLATIADPSVTEFMRDAQRNPDGSFNTAFVSGYVQQAFVYFPQTISLGPDDTTLLLWRGAYGNTPLWMLAPDGATLNTNTDTTDQSVIGSANVGVDNKTHVSHGTGSGFALETLSASGNVETMHSYGFYDGWRATAAGGPDGTLRRLYLRYDHTLALWNVSPDGQYLGDVRLTAPSKKTVVGVAVGGNGRTRILWQGQRGAATVWTISPAGRLLSSVTRPAPAGLTLSALAVGTDNRDYLLWSGSEGQGQIWTQSGKRGFHVLPISLPGGGRASSLAIGMSGDLRVLWRGSDLTGRLQTLSTDGSVLSVHEFPPYQ